MKNSIFIATRAALIAALLFSASGLNAAIKTTTAAGNLSSGSTWVGGVAPVDGDQIVVNHDVAQDIDITLGTSPAPTPQANETPTISASAGSTVTSLPTGTYRVVITNIDSAGRESNRSPEPDPVALTNGVSTPRVTLPAMPVGVASRNIYLSPAGGGSESETLYATGIAATTYELVSSLWENGTVAQSAARALPNASAIKINGTGGSVTVTGSTLTVRGDVWSSNGLITLSTGTVFEFDASQASSPTVTSYHCYLGLSTNQNNAKLVSMSSAENRSTIRSNASGANGNFQPLYIPGSYSAALNCGIVWAQNTDFQRIGTASQHAIDNTNYSLSDQMLYLSSCTFTSCGTVYGNIAMASGASMIVDSNKFIDGLDTTNGDLRFLANPAANGDIVRNIVNNSFGNELKFPSITGSNIRIAGNYFHNGYSFTSTSGRLEHFYGNFCRQTGSSGLLAYFDASDSYVITDNDNGNPHIWVPVVSSTHTRMIFEYTGTQHNDGGDGIYTSLNGTITVRNCIMLPTWENKLTATMVTIDENTRAYLYNNTWFSGEQGGVDTGDLGKVTGMVPVMKNNLGWVQNGFVGGNAGPYLAFSPRNTSDTDVPLDTIDMVLPDGCDYNAAWNLTEGYTRRVAFPTSGYGYNLHTSAALGVHDIWLGTGGTGPDFVDQTRNLGKWGTTKGGTGTTYAEKVAYSLSLLKADPSLIPDLMNYVREGFTPQNPALDGAGYDGSDIGAVSFSAEPPAPTATLTSDVSEGDAPLTVTFTDSLTGGVSTAHQFVWGDGDGSGTGSGSSFEQAHTYTVPGTYEAYSTFTVDGETITSNTLTITVTEATPPPVTRTIFEGRIIFEGNFTAE